MSTRDRNYSNIVATLKYRVFRGSTERQQPVETGEASCPETHLALWLSSRSRLGSSLGKIKARPGIVGN